MMDPSSRRLVLLGPQPRFESLRQALTRVQASGPAAVVTAGWQEDELESDQLKPLMDCLPTGSFNLKLFGRSDRLFEEDAEIIRLLRARQDQLHNLRNVYQLRLNDVLDAARKTLRRQDPLIDLDPERESSIEMVRALDRQYFVRTSQVVDEFEDRMALAERSTVCQHRREIAEQLEKAGVLIIGGGHAAIILNRLRLFEVMEANPVLPVIAWSGGAMALADQVVLFHDSPPQGRGNPEVLRAGMSAYDEFLPLPNARRRLLLEDRTRVELFGRRFSFYQCVILDDQTILDRRQGQWWATDKTQRLGHNGQLEQIRVGGPM